MASLSDDPRLRLLTLTLLYVAQGLPWGFISVGYVVFLADLGLSNAAVGAAIGMAYMPWSFKFFAGPLLDMVPQTRWGRRRPFIILAEFLMGLSLLALMGLDPASQMELVGMVLFAHNTAAAIQDVAVDGLAVDILKEDERGRANSFMWAGKSIGVAIGGGGGTVFAGQFGWPTLFLVLALAIWAIMLLPIMIREQDESASQTSSGPGLSWDLAKQTLGFATPWLGLLVAMVVPIGYATVGTVTTRVMRADLGLTDEMIGFITGVVDPIAAVVGALIGGVLADRFGTRQTMMATAVGIALTLAIWATNQPMWEQTWFLTGWLATHAGLVAAYSTASFGLFMSISNPKIGATHFAGYMAATNLTYGWSAPIGGQIADSEGYFTLYLGAAAIQLVSVALIPLVRPEDARERYRSANPAITSELTST